MPQRALVLLLTSLVIGGCATKRPFDLEPVEVKNVSVFYDNGRTVAGSMKPNTGAMVFYARHTETGEYHINIGVINGSDKPLNFREDRNIEAAVKRFDGESDSVALYVYGTNEYLDVLAERQRRQANAAAWGNAMVVATSGNGYSTTTSSARVSGYDSSGRYSGTATGTSTTTYKDPAAQAAAAQQARSNMDALAASQSQTRQTFESALIRRQTLKKGESATGWIVVDDGDVSLRPGTDDSLLLWVHLGDDEHFFLLRSVGY